MGKIWVFVAIFLWGASSLAAIAEPLTPYAIIQGPTSGSHSQFAVTAPTSDAVTVEIFDFHGNRIQSSEKRISRTYSKWEVVQTKTDRLIPGEYYRLIARSADGIVTDERFFSSVENSADQMKVGLVSCMCDLIHNRRAWERLEATGIELLIIDGDAVYLDRPGIFKREPQSEADIWLRHVETRNRLQLFRWARLVPVAAIWDDHDFGHDNAVNPWRLANQSRAVFETFFPREEIAGVFEHGPGLSAHYHYRGQSFIFLDGRSFQTSKEKGTMFGQEQESWLKEQAKSPTTWLISGSQFFGGYLEKDSYQFNFPNDFDRFIGVLKTIPTKFTFLSGDTHMSEVASIPKYVLGYETREITSSSIHSMSYPGRHKVQQVLGYINPWRLGATSTHNFTILDIIPQVDGRVSYRTDIVTWRGQVKYSSYFTVHPGLTCEALFSPVQ